MKATGFVVSERYETEMASPAIFKTIEEANNYVQNLIADDMREDFFDELEEAGIDTEDDEAVLNYGMEHEHCSTDCYMGRPDWHEFRTDKVTLDLEEDLTVEKAADTKLYVVEEFNRYEALLINALEWAINVSEQTTHDLIHAMGITSEELSAIGYDEDNFPEMHEWINENEEREI